MMKNNSKLLCIVCALGLLTLCCGEDNNTSESNGACQTLGLVKCNGRCIDPTTSSEYCGANEYCEAYEVCRENQSCRAGKCIDKSEEPKDCNPPCEADQTCQNGKCIHKSDQPQSCRTQGYVMCDGRCIDPTTSSEYCGANEYCEGYEVCDKDQPCQNSKCSTSSMPPVDPDCPDGNCKEPEEPATSCASDEHQYNDGCEKDSIENCGDHDIACAAEISGWEDGSCIKGTCHVTACQKDMHPDENACVYDTVEDCGKKGFTCADRVPGWKTGNCTDGKCKVLQCIDGYHVDDQTNECALDTNQCCGAACTKCTSNQLCANGECRDQCPANTKACNGTCIDVTSSTEHCGECGKNCNNDKPAHAQTMRCSESHCQISECETNYRLETQNGAQLCKADTVEDCGNNGTNCSTYDWWDGGDCSNGTCIPIACKGDYYLTKNNSGQNVCKPNNDNNCGGPGIKCTGGKCVDGLCLGDALCNGVTHNLLIDLDHCGKCNNRCVDGLICKNGKCQKGEGNAYCNGQKVVIGSLDRCGGCDRCKDGLICDKNECKTGTGNAYCNGQIVTIGSLDHCGGCDRCKDGLICDKNECKTGTGKAYCNGQIVTIGTVDHCGGCDRCADSLICLSNACKQGADFTYCSGTIINSFASLDHCGACNHRCAENLICSSGVCKTGNGSMYCNGVEINSTIDSAHCGGCNNPCTAGTACKNVNSTPMCVETDDDIITCSGKKINITYDSDNCGQCGELCEDGQMCIQGTCSEPKVGDVISFGQYNKTPIQWYILDKDTVNHRVMLLSMDVLEKRPYHTKSEAVTWAESTIRSWLNGYGKSENKQSQDYTSSNFIRAFSSDERTRIASVQIVNDNNPQFGTAGGVNTNDKVFLLSIDEVKTLLGSTKEDICTKVHCTIDAAWWLRSPGQYAYDAARVDSEGYLGTGGYNVNGPYGVRPALWLNY